MIYIIITLTLTWLTTFYLYYRENKLKKSVQLFLSKKEIELNKSIKLNHNMNEKLNSIISNKNEVIHNLLMVHAAKKAISIPKRFKQWKRFKRNGKVFYKKYYYENNSL